MNLKELGGKISVVFNNLKGSDVLKNLTGTAVGIPLPGAAATRSGTVVFESSMVEKPQTDLPKEALQEAHA